MSIDNARAFLNKLQTDADFRYELTVITREQGHLGRSKFIRDAGFDFTAADLTAAKNEYAGKIPKDMTAIVDFISCGMIIHDPPSTRVA